MRRRRLLAVLGSLPLPLTLPLAGCTGGPGDPITSLAVNRTDAPHTVSVRVVRDGRAVIEGTVEVAAGGVAELGTTPWRRGRYRVTARVDGESALSETFRSSEWFNQLDVVLGADGSVELNKGRAT